MGLYETQNRLGQSKTHMLFFSKNKFKVRLNKKSSLCFILSRVSYSPVLPYSIERFFETLLFEPLGAFFIA
jgi:hypothetical protein